MTVPLSVMHQKHTTNRLPLPTTQPHNSSTALPFNSLPAKLSAAALLARLPQSSPKLRANLTRRLPYVSRLLSPRAVASNLFTASLVFAVLFFCYYVHAHAPAFTSLRRFCRRALRMYQLQLHLHPLSSRAATAAFIFFAADIVSQALTISNNAKVSTAAATAPPAASSLSASVNAPTSNPTAPAASFRPMCGFCLARLARYTVYGFLCMGPFLYLWYEVMNRFGPEDDFRGSLLKCLFEQLTLEPLCIILYIVYDGFICRRGLAETKRKLSAQFFPLWFKNAFFWLPANFANYYIGTPELRVIFANLCSLFWNIYFSGKINMGEVPFSRHHEQQQKNASLSNHDRSVRRRSDVSPEHRDLLIRPSVSKTLIV